MQPQQPPEPAQPPQRERATALEVRNKYGVTALFFLAWTTWCIRDGWFSAPEYEYKTFNKIITVPSALVLLFCLVMAGSAAMTVIRQRREQAAQAPPDAPSSGH
jgi:hypothetical protein